jgi:hypothetical protein
MPVDEIDIQVTEEGTVVELFPDMYIEAEGPAEPTKKHPEIFFESGFLGDKLVPIRVLYPSDWPVERVIGAIPSLFDKKEFCMACERKKRQLLKRLKGIAGGEGSNQEKINRFYSELERLKLEVADLKSGQESPDPAPGPVHHPWGTRYDYLLDKQYKLEEAGDAAQVAVNDLLTKTKWLPKLPSPAEAIEEAKRQRYG